MILLSHCLILFARMLRMGEVGRTLVWILMFAVSYRLQTTPDDLAKKEIDALDCRHPQKVQTGLLSQVCNGKDQGEIESTEQNVPILKNESAD